VKILLLSAVPFALAHGGAQIQIEQTKAGLEKIGVEVEWMRWWDDRQTGDIIHYFGRAPVWLIQMAQAKGKKVVSLELLTEQGSRSLRRLKLQKLMYRTAELARRFRRGMSFTWDTYRYADAFVANTAWEKYLMTEIYGAPPEKTFVVPNGVEEVFLNSQQAERGPWLVCTTTITGRKRVMELARAAIEAQTPVWFVGKPYSDKDEYARRFVELARQNPKFIRYEGPVSDRKKCAEIYRSARGFVLLSAMETRSLSAEEAAACECPLLLSDLPWARSVFNDTVSYCPITPSVGGTAGVLRKFYADAPGLKAPARPLTWPEVGQQFKAVYERVLKTS
jgi:glycosyltransferase involved in cell wall biosynthesis